MIELTRLGLDFELSPTLQANELVAKRRKNGEPVIHMGFGESPFPVPSRLITALSDHAHRKDYLPAAGLPELCDTVKSYYAKHTEIDIDQYDIIIAPGSKLMLYALQMAIAGDLLMPIPSWVSYAPQAKMLGRKVVPVPAKLDDHGYHIAPDELIECINVAKAQGLSPTKLILNSPNNPTGLTIPNKALKDIAHVCDQEDILIISDEIYGFVAFDQSYNSISTYLPEKTVITSGLSKHLSLGGWRLGLGFIPKAISGLHAQVRHIASELWSSVPSPIQWACIQAYEGHEDIERHMKACTHIHAYVNRFIATELKRLGVICPDPQGSFYNYPDFSPFLESLSQLGICNSSELSSYLIKTYGLISLPGVVFGQEPCHLSLRLSGCDYNGEQALNAFFEGEPLDHKYLTNYTPQILKAIEVFSCLIEKVQSDQIRLSKV